MMRLCSFRLGLLAASVLLSFGLPLLLTQPSRSDDTQRRQSLAAFATVARVALSPRCQNCHTSVDYPRQGDDRHRHLFHVARGGSDMGAPALPCSTCHGSANNSASGVPGAEDRWRLAPLAMGWDGLSAAGLCRRLTDPRHNGNRDGDAIVDHLKTPFVTWAWSAGTDRAGRPRRAPPVAYRDFLQAAEAWVRTGEACP